MIHSIMRASEDVIYGSHLLEVVDVTFENLVKLFGEPHVINAHDKTDASWYLLVDGHIMTIYNWKDGKNYLGEDGLNIEDITSWHIGGFDNHQGRILKRYIQSSMN